MSTNDRTYYKITATIFLIIAVMHFMRIVYQWDAVLGEVQIPVWVSAVAVLLSGYLASRGFGAVKK